MKIVMLISSFYPLVGGAERQAQRLSKELVEQGHEVTVFTRMPELEISRVEFIDGIKIVRLKVFKKGKLTPISYLIKVLYNIWKCRKNIDVIHAHSLSATGYTAALASFLFRKPSISKIAGGGNKIGCEAKRMYIAGGLKRNRINFMKKHLSKFIAISEAINSDLSEIGVPENKIELIPNGIKVNTELAVNETKEELGMARNKKIFLYAGRLELVKGIDILLKAWENTSSIFKESSQLIILGEGAYEIEKDKFDNSISFLGATNMVNSYLQKSDYFILPSRYEGISNSLLEAIINKVAVIGSDAGGNTDILNENTGFVFESENHAQLSRILNNTLLDNLDVQEKVNNAYEYVKENYNLTEVTAKYEELYKDLSNEV